MVGRVGGLVKEGSSIDATIIDAPSSTKNKLKQRDPDMHRTKKGNQWHFGMKAHIGIDVKSGLTHTFTITSANEHDLNQAHKLLHGKEKYVFAGSEYRGAHKPKSWLMPKLIGLSQSKQDESTKKAS